MCEVNLAVESDGEFLSASLVICLTQTCSYIDGVGGGTLSLVHTGDYSVAGVDEALRIIRPTCGVSSVHAA